MLYMTPKHIIGDKLECISKSAKFSMSYTASMFVSTYADAPIYRNEN